MPVPCEFSDPTIFMEYPPLSGRPIDPSTIGLHFYA